MTAELLSASPYHGEKFWGKSWLIYVPRRHPEEIQISCAEYHDIEELGEETDAFGALVAVDGPDEDAFAGRVGDVAEDAEDVHIESHRALLISDSPAMIEAVVEQLSSAFAVALGEHIRSPSDAAAARLWSTGPGSKLRYECHWHMSPSTFCILSAFRHLVRNCHTSTSTALAVRPSGWHTAIPLKPVVVTNICAHTPWVPFILGIAKVGWSSREHLMPNFTL